MKYRSEIDGLRAVAVLPVLFFHAGWHTFSGGYVGVDVFFVISGYLISSILTTEIAAQRFSILAFYERRVRRIFPCLLAMMIASCAVSTVLLVPLDLQDFAKSVVAVTLFASNILFYHQSGYFDDPSAIKPFLHTWSLAVEEQFYIVFPIALWLLHRYAKRQILWWLGAGTLLSLGLSVWYANTEPPYAFFMAHLRAWELLVGAVLALAALPNSDRRLLREVLAWTGMGLITYAVFAFSAATPFPGAYALFPVLGAALLLQFARDTTVGWLLSRKPLVFVGVISYSLYLWHWPVIVFSEYYLVEKLSGLASVAAIVTSLAIATFSWRYVERPFRVRGLISRPVIFAGAGAAMSVMLVVATVCFLSNGWPGRFPEEVSRMESFVNDYSPRRAACHRGETTVIPLTGSCRYGADAPAAYAVWGDSHAVELTYAIGEVARRQDQSVLQISYSSCPPALDMDVPIRPGCRSHNLAVAEFLTQAREVSTVLLIAHYEDEMTDFAALSTGLRKSVTLLTQAGKRVVLIYPIPTAHLSIPRTLARYVAAGADPRRFEIKEPEFLARNSRIFALLDSFTTPNIRRVFPHKRLCYADACKVYANGGPLYFDAQHLSMGGAQYLEPLFEPLFEELFEPKIVAISRTAAADERAALESQ